MELLCLTRSLIELSITFGSIVMVIAVLKPVLQRKKHGLLRCTKNTTLIKQQRIFLSIGGNGEVTK